jgi:hypothetical protein
VLGASGRVFVGVNFKSRGFPLCHSVYTEQLLVANAAAAEDSELRAIAVSNIFTMHLGPLRCICLSCCYMDEHRANPRFCLGPDEYVLRATLLGGYDGSLNDGPTSSFANLDASLDRAIGHVG